MRRKKVLLPILVLLLSLVLGGVVQAGDGNAPPDWRGLLHTYRRDENVGQLLFIRYTGDTGARATLYVKQRNHHDLWRCVLDTEAEVGRNGIGKTREGDGKTPSGDFAVESGFGIWADPGTALPYIGVTDTTYACGENCEYYNQIIDTWLTGHACRGEHMIECAPAYHYGLTIDYNKECEYGLGSGIFVHCVDGNGYTLGCVALAEADMITVLRYAEPGMRVVIG